MKRILFFTVLLISFLSSSAIVLALDSYSTHWLRPVTTGGAELAPYPHVCGKCHQSQFTDWGGSLHSKSVGPGLLAQLAPTKNPAFAISCYYCHAPAVEQTEVLASVSGFRENRKFDPELKKHGVTCAACHMRSGTVKGPNEPVINSGGAHASLKDDLFKSSEFCSACHQLETGFMLNGKVLVNTYREWKESLYAEKGITCQKCHMPGGRHLFRGIHDAEMTRRGVKIDVQRAESISGISAKLIVTNTATGHAFPTYCTPLVVIRAFMIGKDDKVIAGTEKKDFIGRQVTLDLTQELFDTRILPFKSFNFSYEESSPPSGADRLVFQIWVLPDEFYNRFYKMAIKRGGGNDYYTKALKDSEESIYLLYNKELKLKQ